MKPARRQPPGIYSCGIEPSKYLVPHDEEEYLDLLIYHGTNGYPIEYDRINTTAKLAGWIHHLAQKGNVTSEHIIALIEWFHQKYGKIDFDA